MSAYLLHARGVNDAYYQALFYMRVAGIPVMTRNGAAFRAPGPVITEYTTPRERVLFSPVRDANPFFHLFESLWILAGREDVRFLSYLNSRIAQYSDNGLTFHGAYGARLFAQLPLIIEKLRNNPGDRRAVAGIWDPMRDLASSSLDLPCNVMLKFDGALGELQLSVFNRSNDIQWGAYGANAVQFSMLQEYVAAAAGLRVGPLYQISTDWHWYGTERPAHPFGSFDLYALGSVTARPLMPEEEYSQFQQDLPSFFTWATAEGPCIPAWETTWFAEVAEPAWCAWCAWKRETYAGDPKPREISLALEHLDRCGAPDWQRAMREWLQRRTTISAGNEQ